MGITVMRKKPRVSLRNLFVRMRPLLGSLAAAGLFLGPLAQTQADELVASCVACHGADGVGKADQYPNLQKQKQAYLIKQLKDFRSGARLDATMTTIAKPLTDKQIEHLAQFFAQVE